MYALTVFSCSWCIIYNFYSNYRTKPEVALAGGVHESVLVSGTDDGDIIAAGMLIIGSENVQVSSIALQDDKISANNQLKLNRVTLLIRLVLI